MDRGVSRPADDPIASGRAADIYDAGPGRVLRRKRSGDIPAHEVTAMRHAHHYGFPVPEVFSIDGPEMVMERVDGPVLFDSLAERPWRIGATGRLLADLHRRLAAIPIDGVEIRTMFGAPEALVHGDLHPGNVLASPSGPVVIDWENAAAGPCDADVATTWLLMSVADLDDVGPVVRWLVSIVRRLLVRSFLAAVERPRPETVRAVCTHRLDDPNLRPHEKARIRRFMAAHG